MSEVKVNKISPRSGTTVTLGDSGDTFTIPSGATINNQGTATNFGATGSASWTTTVKTSGFTAVAGEGYFVDTSSGAVSVNLPAGTAGAVVAFKDYLNSFDTHALTLVQNGSDKIGGSTVNATLDTEGIAVTLVFIDSTQGWLVTDSGLQSEAPTAQYIAATGGTVSTVCTNFKVHTFTGPGTFCVSAVGNAAGSNTVSYMVIAGGGGGGHSYPTSNAGGGGGAGGYRESKAASDSYTASPLNATCGAPGYNLPVAVQAYPIQVGGGGPGATGSAAAANGINSVFSTITSAGGGSGAHSGPGGGPNPAENAGTGGSGGGGGGGTSSPGSWGSGAAGNTPPVSPPQGNAGGTNYKISSGSNPDNPGAGGGGAGAAAPDAPSNAGGAGGAGTTTSINGTPTGRAGGGGGGGNPVGSGGSDGGGPAGGGNGTDNTGGGGSGTMCGSDGGNGGSGIVIIRYKFQ